MGAAAAAVLGCAGTTMAQFVANIGSAGPFPTTAFNEVGLNLNTINGQPIDAGEYVWYSISLDWDGSNASFGNQWSSEARAVLADVASIPAASTSVPSPAVIYGGGNATNRGGVAAPNAQSNVTARKIGWKGPMTVNYVTDGTGDQGLYLYMRQTFASGTNPGVTWSNLTVSLFESAPTPPANDLCSGATDISAAANAGLVTTGTPWVSAKFDMVNSNPLVEVPEPTGFTCVTTARKMVWLKFTPAITGAYQLSTCLGGAIPFEDDIARSAFAVYTTVDGLCPATSAGLTLVAGSCATLNCSPSSLSGTQATTQSSGTNIALSAGTTYYILIGRPGQSGQPITNIIGAQEENYRLAITRVPPPPDCTITAPAIGTPAYNNKAGATANNTVTIAAGDTLCGTTTGTSTTGTDQALTSANYWRLKTLAPAPGVGSVIKRYQLAYASLTSGHTVTVRGLTQTAGVPNAGTDTVIYTMSGVAPAPTNTIRWYAHGTLDRELFLAVTGNTTTTLTYHLTVSEANVTPVDAGTYVEGPITITSVGQGHTTDTDIWVYDSDGNAIPGWGNDDTLGPPSSLQSTLTRTFTPGTYYIAVGGFNLANNLGSPADDNFRTGAVMDFPGVTVTSNVPSGVQNRSISITDSVNSPVAVSLSATERWEVLWVKLVVGPSGPTQCNPADIAATDSTPGADGCVDNGDFSLFISEFFSADCSATCGNLPVVQCNSADIAATDSTPGADGCVDNGDFSLFISSFFSADCSATCNP
jgi:hypothetical protein